VNSVQRNGANPATPTAFIYVPYNPKDRRTFIGGSDARIIMGNDEDRLLLLWKEKRGGNRSGRSLEQSDCSNGSRYRRPQSTLV
jgi:hypothetical protein